MKKLALILSLVLCFHTSGCLFPVDVSKLGGTSVSVSVNQDIVAKIRAASTDVTPEDKVILYKMFKGYSSLLNSAVPSTSLDAFTQFAKVREIYGWDQGKYPKLTAVVKEILDPYKVPKPISEVKKDLILIIDSIAEAFKE